MARRLIYGTKGPVSEAYQMARPALLGTVVPSYPSLLQRRETCPLLGRSSFLCVLWGCL